MVVGDGATIERYDVELMLRRSAKKFFMLMCDGDEPGSVPLDKLIAFLASAQFDKKRGRAPRMEIAKSFFESIAASIEATRLEDDSWGEDLMILPVLLTQKGRCRKTSRDYKLQVLKAIRGSPHVKTAASLFAGRRIWGKRTPTHGAPTASAVRGTRWDWDVFFGYMVASWKLMKDVHCVSMLTDGVWLAGEETTYYNFLDPETGENAWSPIQACLPLIALCVVRLHNLRVDSSIQS